jgi:hypothetical protein
MQMGRWFGYRSGYHDLCKGYMPPSIIDNFAIIIEATEDLIRDFKIMAEAKKTPNDFGLAVRQHPDSALQITARNKQKNVHKFVFNMKLDGQSKETSWLSNNAEVRRHNMQSIINIISALSDKKTERIANNFLWRDVDKDIIINFLAEFKTYQTDPLGITARMPIEFVKKYAKERNTKWDVALYNGQGDEKNINDDISIKKEKRQLEKRKLQQKDGFFEIKNRQVSTGNAESTALTPEQRKELGSDRKAIRQKMVNPLLMLHILQTEEDEELAAFGVSFPGSVLSSGEPVSLTINSVYYSNLLEELSYDSEADDQA